MVFSKLTNSVASEPVNIATHNSWSVLRLEKCQTLLAACMEIRATQAKDSVSCTDGFDDTADIYLLIFQGKPLATMRVNQARRGSLDCEEFYPPTFLNEFRSVIGSASRFARHAAAKPDHALMREFVCEVWRDQFVAGMRVDLINVHTPMIPYYQRLGYQLVCNSFFRHPRLGTDSYVMCLIASPEVPGGLGKVFTPGNDPLQIQRLGAELGFCNPKLCEHHSAGCSDSVQRFVCPIPETKKAAITLRG